VNNETKLKALRMWQEAGYVHEYMCCGHTPMTPVEENGTVRLKCEKCGRRQDDALDIAYGFYEDGCHEEMQAFLKGIRAQS